MKHLLLKVILKTYLKNLVIRWRKTKASTAYGIEIIQDIIYKASK